MFSAWHSRVSGLALGEGEGPVFDVIGIEGDY